MITSAFILLGTTIVNLLLLPFPDGSGYPQGVVDAVNTFSGYLANLSPILPYGTLLTLIEIVIYVEIAILIFRFGKWAFSHVPAVGGRG